MSAGGPGSAGTGLGSSAGGSGWPQEPRGSWDLPESLCSERKPIERDSWPSLFFYQPFLLVSCHFTWALCWKRSRKWMILFWFWVGIACPRVTHQGDKGFLLVALSCKLINTLCCSGAQDLCWLVYFLPLPSLLLLCLCLAVVLQIHAKRGFHWKNSPGNQS